MWPGSRDGVPSARSARRSNLVANAPNEVAVTSRRHRMTAAIRRHCSAFARRWLGLSNIAMRSSTGGSAAMSLRHRLPWLDSVMVHHATGPLYVRAVSRTRASSRMWGRRPRTERLVRARNRCSVTADGRRGRQGDAPAHQAPRVFTRRPGFVSECIRRQGRTRNRRTGLRASGRLVGAQGLEPWTR